MLFFNLLHVTYALCKLSRCFEGSDLVLRNRNRSVQGNITCDLRLTCFGSKRTETAEIYTLATTYILFDTIHQRFNNYTNSRFIVAGSHGNFTNEFSFCHKFYTNFLVKHQKTLQSYYKLLKYKSFFEKKLQKSLFFCNFVPDLHVFDPKKYIFMLNSLIYSRLYEWYEMNHRILPWRETEDAYSIWLSEVILQQTRVAQGMEYYMRFVTRWPTVEALAAADEAEVLREWQGLGYYSRARNLHKAAKLIVESLKFIVERRFPQTFEELRALPGIGDYTAGAIASFAYDLPYPAMDGNVYRVVARLMDIDEPFDTTSGKKLFHKQIESLLDREHPRLFNSAIMELGALHCTPVLGDACESCPLQNACQGYAHGTAALLPVRKPRPQLRDRWFTYHIYLQAVSDQPSVVRTLIRRREAKDIWYHLYEFPCTEGQTEDKYPFTHILSHQKLHARYIIHKVQKMPDIAGTIVIRWEDLNDYALSRLTLRVLDTMQHTV